MGFLLVRPGETMNTEPEMPFLPKVLDNKRSTPQDFFSLNDWVLAWTRVKPPLSRLAFSTAEMDGMQRIPSSHHRALERLEGP